jgi:hypothetical protein
MSDPIREGIQKVLDIHGDGWTVAHYVCCIGLERLTNGEVRTASWQYAPPDQPHYVIPGLLEDAADALIQRELGD